MDRRKKILRIVLVACGVVAVLFAGVRIYLQTLLPDIDGELRMQALSAKVTVVRDTWGVPHIEAQNAHDAYYALGYTVAQDRLFQMELQRRLAKGELAEILGPELLQTDRQFRTYLFRHAAERMIMNAGKIRPQSLEIFKAFLDGELFYREVRCRWNSRCWNKARVVYPADSASFMGYMNYHL